MLHFVYVSVQFKSVVHSSFNATSLTFHATTIACFNATTSNS